MWIKIDHCPLCYSSKIFPYKKGNLSLEGLTPDKIKITDAEYGQIWDLSRCPACGYIFANPGPGKSLLAILYNELKDPDYEAEAEGRRRNFRRLLSRLEKFLPEKGHLFDVGAATGLLLIEARQRGWQVAGIEPSRWAVETAAKKYGLHLYLGSFEDFKGNGNQYDAITLIDILEHTPEPRKIVVKARELLKPDGIIVIVTPDIESLAARLAGRRWWHFRPGHLGYFHRKSLQTLLHLTSFQVLAWKRYSWSFSFDYILKRLPGLSWLTQVSNLASLWPRIQIKLALGDSFEVYAQKKEII